MAIIYSYPTVTPSADDLVLGTDVNGDGKPTKNFTIQSIVDIVQGGATGLGAVLAISSDALAQPATNFTNVQGTGTFTAGTFTDGTMSISGGVGTGFTAFTSTAITGTLQTAAQPNITSLGALTALVIDGAISGTNVITSTTLAGASNTNIASTLAIKTYVDSNPSGAESLAATLAVGNTTGGTDIAVSAADDITFTDTSKIIMGSGSDATVEHDGSDFKITNTKGDIELTNSAAAGSIKLTTSATATKVELNGVAGVELDFNSTKKFEVLTGGAKTTGDFEATGSGTFVNLLNSGTYQDSSGDVGTSGQLLSSTGTGTNWVTEAPLYTWIIEADSGTGSPYTVQSGDTIDFVGVGSISTAWDNASKELRISSSNPDGSGAANQVTFWSDADTISGATGFTFAGGATGKVAIGGELEVGGVLTDGTFTGSSGTYTGYVSITSAAFVGPLTGNASTATALATAGTIQLDAGSGATQGVGSNAVTYTDGGDITLTTTLADTTVTAKALTNLPTPTSSAITASDTILAAMAKLQGQITSTTGLAYEGTWDARNSAEGGSSDGGNPDLTQASTKVNGHFYIVSTAGNAEPNGGGGTQLSPWAVGDWCIYVANGSATDEWQKLDQSNEVLGSGAANKIAKWTATNTLGTGLISDDGTTVTIGTNGNLTVQGDTILGDDAAADTITLNGPTTFVSTGIFNVGIGLGGATYGSAGQVLTSGGGAGVANTWTTPTVGVVTSITGSTGITVAGTAAVPTVAITYSGIGNAIHAASSSTPVATDEIWFNDITGGSTHEIKNCTIEALPLDNYTSWTLAGDSGSSQAITSGNTATIAGGTGIVTAASATDTLTVNIDTVGTDNAIEVLTAAVAATGDFMWFSDIDDNTLKKSTLANLPFVPAVSGTQYTLPMFATTSTLGDSMVSQNAGGTETTISGNLNITGIYEKSGSQIALNDLSNASTLHNSVFLGNIPAGLDVTGGSNCIIIGYRAGNALTSGDSNVLIGKDAGLAVTTGGDNIFIGAEAGVANTNGSNIGIGSKALEASTSSTNNVAIGNQVAINLTTGDKNIYIGPLVVAGAVDAQEEIVIGYQTTGNGSNTITLGTSSSTVFYGGQNGINIGSAAKPWGDLYVDDGFFDGNITVDGSIIHGGGGGGTAKGGTFSKVYTTGSIGASAIAFTITRATGAAMVFDVMFTGGGTGSGTSTCKKYTVVKKYGLTDASIYYNKIIDTGPALGGSGTADYNIVFDVSGSAGDAIECNITPVGVASQEIGITIDLGFGKQDAVVVMN